MENMVTFVNKLVYSISYDESLSSMLREKIKDTQRKPFIGEYYNLTELCNPAHSYWTRVSSKVEAPVELQRLFEWGKKIHSDTQRWLETFPDFVVSEGTLDGAWVDLPGVRGRVDCRIGDSIFEIKTKLTIPQTREELLLSYPQDVEQIAFYSVIHPSHDKINYLIFVKDSHPFEIRAFKIEIKDISKLKSLMKLRMNMLDDSIKNKDPVQLGRCRYYGKECQFETGKVCHCEKLATLSTEQLEKAIELTFDEEMTKNLEEIRKKYNSSKKFFSTKDIISPRKYSLESEWSKEKLKGESESFLGAMIKELPIKLSFEERKKIFASTQEHRIHIAYRFAKLKSSANQDSLIIPYIVKSNMSNVIQSRPNEYFIAELGIISANYGKTEGMIFVIYPNKNNFVQVFKITYKKINEIQNKVREIVTRLDKNEADPFQFPPCPNFMNDSKTCPLMKECNSKEGFGCIEN